MNSLYERIRSSLYARVLISMLLIIAVGGLVLITAAEMTMPAAFSRHREAMALVVPDDALLVEDLYAGFWQALTESGIIALAVSLMVAVLMSVFVVRRIVEPIRRMAIVTQAIADGNYDQRVPLSRGARDDHVLDELDQLAQSMNRMAAALTATETRRLRLIGDVAHELGTPLTAIMGYAEGLLDGVIPAEPDVYGRVHDEAERMRRLLVGLQQLSRLEEGAFALDLETLLVSELVEQTVARILPKYRAHGTELELGALPDLWIRGDRARLAQVLLNLLDNALEYTPPGGHVQVRATCHETWLRFEVADDGIGIAEEHLERVFERFYRVDDTLGRSVGGIGVGLTICRHIINAHGGRIWAESKGPGRGSIFSFVIPCS